jgi:hypothetical protein
MVRERAKVPSEALEALEALEPFDIAGADCFGSMGGVNRRGVVRFKCACH